MSALRWTPALAAAVFGVLLALGPGTPSAFAAAKANGPCATCHADWKTVLPANHPAVAGGTLAACVACHKPVSGEKAQPNRFAAALHRAHAAGDCGTCHSARGKGAIAVVAGKVALPVTPAGLEALKPAMASYATSPFLDATHAKGGVDCAGCHGAGVPAAGAEIANERCLECHGPLEQLVAKTRPAQFPDRNPHQSHLGEIACTVCHKGHEASVVYCLDCHRKFEIRFRATSAKGVREAGG